ncbi:MAG: MFS transporter [Bacteroidales bacterium]|nr:MFS transporter [Bacteroidales bacterium]
MGNAIALNSATFNGARLIGPAVAGILVAIVGEGICFLINAISYISVIIALLQIKILNKKGAVESNNMKKSFKEGFYYTFGFPPIRALLILLGIISLFGLPYTVLLPAYAKEILKGSSDTLGFLMSAAGAGALIAAFYLASRKSVIGQGRLISISTIMFGGGIVVASLQKFCIVTFCVIGYRIWYDCFHCIH